MSIDWKKLSEFDQTIGRHIGAGIKDESEALRTIDRVRLTMTGARSWPVPRALVASSSFIATTVAKAFGRPCTRVVFVSRSQPVSDWPDWTDMDARNLFDDLVKGALKGRLFRDAFKTMFLKYAGGHCPHCRVNLEGTFERDLKIAYPRLPRAGEYARINRDALVVWYAILHCRGQRQLADTLEPLMEVFERVAILGEHKDFMPGVWLVQVE